MKTNEIRARVLLSTLLATSASLAAVVPFSPLPAGAMTKVPMNAPKNISGADRVQGLFVAQAPIQPNSRNYKRIEIVDSQKDAEAFSSRGFVSRSDNAPKHCVYMTDDTLSGGDPWPALARGEIASFAGSGQKPIVGVHVESLEEGAAPGTTPSLGIVDAWLDTRTRGLKLVSKVTVPLGKVAEGPYGIRVLAARSDDAVHFVVLPPVPEPGVEQFESQVDRAVIESGGEVGTSMCRHNRITLEARPGTGEHAVVSYQHVVPAERDPADGKVDVIAINSSDLFSTARTQLVQVHLSASRNQSASAPVISVSFRLDKPKPFGS